ncbi:SusD/RagB family nutrient-binding outer membrane lipoprotein [Dyadobacter pollutisoli]|uniref:SusD/RagB family nutrient-binding outer membrane lipoprotein n=1 Tax=Dyadobacter pollutisoli TaxID=2910158 RepID=A0A9E8NEN9_9BACT|nr:SusD/RagB family nutrient-binding outer membrane lipoprotein [Dyadobacter pollutisoli]WAC13181.1 SusD/RagB family nutrient-binding outer membrane lipoprotein [Dyadobacter pollutisoli]
MKKIFLYGASTLFFASACVSGLDEDYNIDPKKATQVPAATLMGNAQFNLSNIITTPDYNYNPFRYYLQYWAAVQYPEESRYNIQAREINTNFWDVLYQDVLSDLREARKTVEADAVVTADEKANQLASIEVLEVYAWSVLVNTYGNIPYGQALDITNVQAVYEDDAAIYTDLIKRLDAAIAAFHTDAPGFGDGDLYYGGDLEHWVKFAHSLKLRIGITLADADAAAAKKICEQAAAHVFSSHADDAQLNYTANPPTASPVYDNLRQRNDNVGANTMVDVLSGLADPRLNEYVRPATAGANAGKYVGGIYGSSNAYAQFAQPSAVIRNPQLPGVLLSYTEVEFLLAEAKMRGFDVGGTAQEHYDKAVTASIVGDWGGSTGEATAYLAKPAVAFDAANWKKSIGTQKWIALYNQPVEGWKEWRRLDFPVLKKPTQAETDIPLRFPYPFTEQNLNAANYQAASAAMGGDVVTSKIFWDVK